ncbi:ABC transporter permease [uncultured Amnibacterium sp.]|uniref:ABC transporter permease n=1 Tax=uncultured Amnibacterium sp. TaxID=1631851 RepID=UPI0035CC7069
MTDYLFVPAHWVGQEGILTLLGQHIAYSGASLLLALAIGLPIGIRVGQTGRGTAVIAGVANSLRALPSLGLLVLLVVLLSPAFASDLAFLVPSLIVLIVLAVPPVMTGAYAGIAAVDPAVVDAARGMGMTDRAILFGVQLPCALPLILSGVRGGVLQIVSTATIAASVSLGGLGRLIIDGLAANDYGQMVAGAVMVALLVVVLDLLFVLLGRFVVSPGLTRAVRARRPIPSPAAISG